MGSISKVAPSPLLAPIRTTTNLATDISVGNEYVTAQPNILLVIVDLIHNAVRNRNNGAQAYDQGLDIAVDLDPALADPQHLPGANDEAVGPSQPQIFIAPELELPQIEGQQEVLPPPPQLPELQLELPIHEPPPPPPPVAAIEQQPQVPIEQFTPEGMKFCSGCRSNKKIEDFHDGRKMCYRHRKSKDETKPPDYKDAESLSAMLKEWKDSETMPRLEATCVLNELPGHDDILEELKKKIEEEAENKNVEMTEQQESMRRARMRCRPLIELILKATGYSFVYKDCRSGRRLKYAHSLRYLCAQRLDQDLLKRRSAANSAERKRAAAGLSLFPNGEGTTSDDFNAATIAAIVAASQAQAAQAENGEGDSELDTSHGPLTLDDAARLAAGGLNLPNPLPPVANPLVPTVPASSNGDNGDDDDNDEEGTDSEKKGKGKKGKGKGKNGKSRSQPKMERYDCKGCLIINIFHDDSTSFFTLTHPLKHPEYKDVVGNRLRGTKFIPQPISLDQVLEDEPEGSIDAVGKDVLAKLENTAHTILDLVKQLRSSKRGGEEEVANLLYEKTEPARKMRVIIEEAMTKESTSRDKAKEKKRKRESESGELSGDEGASRTGVDPSQFAENTTPVQAETNALPPPLTAANALSLAAGLSADGSLPDSMNLDVSGAASASDIHAVVAMYMAQHTHQDSLSTDAQSLSNPANWTLDPALQSTLSGA